MLFIFDTLSMAIQLANHLTHITGHVSRSRQRYVQHIL